MFASESQFAQFCLSVLDPAMPFVCSTEEPVLI